MCPWPVQLAACAGVPPEDGGTQMAESPSSGGQSGMHANLGSGRPLGDIHEPWDSRLISLPEPRLDPPFVE